MGGSRIGPRKSARVTPADGCFGSTSADHVIGGVPESLLATDLVLGGLNADVAEQELNLVEFSTCLTAARVSRRARLL